MNKTTFLEISRSLTDQMIGIFESNLNEHDMRLARDEIKVAESIVWDYFSKLFQTGIDTQTLLLMDKEIKIDTTTAKQLELMDPDEYKDHFGLHVWLTFLGIRHGKSYQ